MSQLPTPFGPDPTLEQEERAMKKGKGRMIAMMVLVVVAVIVGLVVFMLPSDDEAYAKLGRNINRLDTEHFDRFWACALQGSDVSGFRNDGELRTQINLRASRAGRRFGAHLRDDCIPILNELPGKLEALIPPQDLKGPVDGILAASRNLVSATSDFVGYLDSMEGPYDEEDATPQVTRIARGWYEYRVAYGAANDAIRAKIEH